MIEALELLRLHLEGALLDPGFAVGLLRVTLLSASAGLIAHFGLERL